MSKYIIIYAYILCIIITYWCVYSFLYPLQWSTGYLCHNRKFFGIFNTRYIRSVLAYIGSLSIILQHLLCSRFSRDHLERLVYDHTKHVCIIIELIVVLYITNLLIVLTWYLWLKTVCNLNRDACVLLGIYSTCLGECETY